MTDEENRSFIFAVGAKLKDARKIRGITQKQAAEYIGVNQSYLSSVENGKKLFSMGYIIKLINYYQVPYEMIFGENSYEKSSEKDKELCVPKKPNVEKLSGQVELLFMLLENTECDNLIFSTDIYMKMCIYLIFRKLYIQNPRNSDKIFTISLEKAEKAAKKVINETPDRLSDFVNKCHANKKRIELPIEKNGQLREFIKECEDFLKSIDNNYYNTAM